LRFNYWLDRALGSHVGGPAIGLRRAANRQHGVQTFSSADLSTLRRLKTELPRKFSNASLEVRERHSDGTSRDLVTQGVVLILRKGACAVAGHRIWTWSDWAR
jgi:hypothetical protein